MLPSPFASPAPASARTPAPAPSPAPVTPTVASMRARVRKPFQLRIPSVASPLSVSLSSSEALTLIADLEQQLDAYIPRSLAVLPGPSSLDRPRRPLSLDAIIALWCDINAVTPSRLEMVPLIDFARALERAHGIVEGEVVE